MTSLLSYHYSIIYITIILVSYDTIIIIILHYYHIYRYYYIVVYLYYTYIYIYSIYYTIIFVNYFLSMAPLINCPHPEAWNHRQSQAKLCDRPWWRPFFTSVGGQKRNHADIFPDILASSQISGKHNGKADHDIFSDHVISTCDFYDEKCGFRRTFLEFPFWGSHDGFAQAVHSTLRRRWVCWLLISQAFGCL